MQGAVANERFRCGPLPIVDAGVLKIGKSIREVEIVDGDSPACSVLVKNSGVHNQWINGN